MSSISARQQRRSKPSSSSWGLYFTQIFSHFTLSFMKSYLIEAMRAEGMAFKLVLVLLLFSLPSNSSEDKNDVTIVIKSSALEAEIDDSFVCATIDWWPHEKCNYNQCPWGNASVLNLDLNHSYLSKSIQAFSPLRIRVGGSLEDQVVYGVGSLESSCDPFTYVSGGLFGFSEGCLSMERWDELNHLFQKTG